MIQELSTKEKIETLEFALRKLEGNAFNYWICNLVAQSHRLRNTIDDINNTDAVILIPELLKYKPKDRSVDKGWFPADDYESRIKVVKSLLRTLKRRKT